jgi:hypothetical protein
MLNKLKDRLEQAAEDIRQATRELEETFDDPMVQQTDWHPARRGGTNVRSRKLHRSGPERLTFRPALQAFMFPAALLAGGVAILVYQPFGDIEPPWMETAFGVAALAGALLWTYRISKPTVLDRQLGFCWSGWSVPGSAEAARDRKDGAVLDEVHAIQVIPERVSGSEGGRGYHSYEINLVLEDGSRLNLVDHSKQRIIRDDAQTLGEFLQVPVWDASGFGRRA